MARSQEMFKIEREYSKNDNLKLEDIKKLRQWVETQYLPATSDLLLFLCLHSCYYDVDRAKKTINSYHTLRAGWPEVFKNRNPSTGPLLSQLSVSVEWPLKQCTSEGYKVFFLKIVDSDVSKYDMDEQLKLFFVVIDFWLSKLGSSEGFVVILDCKGATWGHLPKFGINTARKLLAYVQEAFPVRLKAVHCINSFAIVDKILFIAKIFMKKELLDIIHIHSNLETLYKLVPKSCLPKDYGGDDLSIQELHEEMKETLLDNSEFFAEEDDSEGETKESLSFSETEDSFDIRL